MDYTEAFLQCFWDKVNKTETCWLWTGSKDKDGYGGNVYWNGKGLKPHRISLSIHLGRPITAGMEVAHAPIICHNRACVNPVHLREATHRENQLDKHLDGTMILPSWSGKLPSIESHRRQFTKEQIHAIRLDTRSHRIIGEDYGCCRQTISFIKSQKLYAWVTD